LVSHGWLSSPDGGKYPFVLVFRTKDSADQQENGWLKKREPFASKKRNAF